MEFIVHPQFLIGFAVAGFLVFYALGASEKQQTRIAKLRLTQWVIVVVSAAIVTFAVFKVLHDHNGNPSQSRTEAAPVTVR